MLTAADLLYVGLIFVWAVLLDVITFENKLYVVMIMWVGLTGVISNAASVELVIRIIAFALLVTIYVAVAFRLFHMVRNLLRLPRPDWLFRRPRRALHVAPAA